MIDTHDWIQISALIIFVVELIFIAVYFNDYGKPTGMYVSDILFEVMPYKVLMTIFVVCQTTFSLMFIYRTFNTKKAYFIIMSLAVFVCLSGWIALNTEYRNTDGEVGDTHTYGTIIFMAGCVMYTILLLYTIRYKILGIHKLQIENILAVLVLLLMILCVIFGSIFIAALMNEGKDAWLFEHAAFMVEVMAHIFFFSIETPNPWKQADFAVDPASEKYKTAEPLKQKNIDPASIPLLPITRS